MEDDEDPGLPPMLRRGGLSQTLESTGSMLGVLLFLLYSSSSFLSVLGQGAAAAWTVLLVGAPVLLSALGGVLEGRPRAARTLCAYGAYVAVPAMLALGRALVAEKGSERWVWAADLAVVVALWAPLGLGWLGREVSATGEVGVWGPLTCALSTLNLFLVLRPFATGDGFGQIGYTFALSPGDVALAAGLAAASLAALIPLGVATRAGRLARLRGALRRARVVRGAVVLLGLYFGALVEEALFRGALQNLLERAAGRRDAAALAAASALFALSRLARAPAARWRRALVAAVGGPCYGVVWRRTGKVTAAALAHALVEYVWRALFEKTATA